MANPTTYIKLDRNITNWRWYKDPVTKSVFIHCILSANIKDGIFCGETVKRGQFITSISSLAENLGLSQKQVRSALGRLKRTNEVASTSTNRYTLITVNNYDMYQSQRANKTASKGQTEGKQRASKGQQSKNNKNIDANASIKERKKGADAPVPADADCSPRDWEIEHKVPERFIGRFPNFEMWEEWRLNH